MPRCLFGSVTWAMFPSVHPLGTLPEHGIGKQYLSPFPSFSEPQSQPHLSREARKALKRTNRYCELREKVIQSVTVKSYFMS